MPRNQFQRMIFALGLMCPAMSFLAAIIYYPYMLTSMYARSLQTGSN